LRWLASIAVATAFSVVAAGAQTSVVVDVRDAGPGPGPALLVQALAARHTVITPRNQRYVLSADSAYSSTVIVLGTDAVAEGTVHGDLIVVGGDLYMHPGATIDGRAVAIGGGVYESTLAHTGAVASYRDFTYDISPIAGGYALSYRAFDTPPAKPIFSLGGIGGLSVPGYDRSNGLSLPLGVSINVPYTGVEIAPSLAYRSQLGRLDPMLAVSDQLDRRTMLLVEAGRETATNDAWIRSNLINSAEYLLVGDDTRNYYRASVARAVLSRTWEWEGSSLEPYAGARAEHAESVRPGINSMGGPWALSGRHDGDDVLRPNPPVDPGTTSSLIAGAKWRWTNGDVRARAAVDEEVGHFSSKAGFARSASTFAQTTVDGTVGFSTFGSQSLRFTGHGVFTGGNDPRQRWAYVGGPGSIPTIDLLAQGGDQLVYLDAGYAIPIEQVALPMVGSPVVTLREVLGGATVNRFPTLSQATGVRVSVSAVYAEFLIDPVHHHHYTGIGLALDR
jgi:hypothetical protein